MELLSILNFIFILIIISKVEYILHGIIVKQREIAWNYCQISNVELHGMNVKDELHGIIVKVKLPGMNVKVEYCMVN